jgi:hypothetical protein
MSTETTTIDSATLPVRVHFECGSTSYTFTVRAGSIESAQAQVAQHEAWGDPDQTATIVDAHGRVVVDA